ncbi:uncharacterized protein [Rutidosis leptorrhynchoides]|uniref:uncharacterized protein n=1 Tax=Rutidosis leptorrhynchoides TaxID=125765 RepID=UPI003A9A56EC
MEARVFSPKQSLQIKFNSPSRRSRFPVPRLPSVKSNLKLKSPQFPVSRPMFPVRCFKNENVNQSVNLNDDDESYRESRSIFVMRLRDASEKALVESINDLVKVMMFVMDVVFLVQIARIFPGIIEVCTAFGSWPWVPVVWCAFRFIGYFLSFGNFKKN